MRPIHLLSIAVLLSIWLGSCDKAVEPVATVAIAPTDIVLPYPGFSTLTLDWKIESSEGPEGSMPVVFLHLLGSDGAVERTFDHPLPMAWEAGTHESYEVVLYQSALAPPLEPGGYRLTFGLYDSDGRRWPLAVDGEAVAEMEYLMAQVDTTSDPSQVPMFYFSPSWLPLEAGTDVQILGRRMLTDEGAIRLAEIPAPGSVWMALRLSEPTAMEELELMEGETEPGFTLNSSCGGPPQSVSGWGAHELRVPVLAGEGGELPEECEITLQPNFQIIETSTLARRSIGLEVLAWNVD